MLKKHFATMFALASLGVSPLAAQEFQYATGAGNPNPTPIVRSIGDIKAPALPPIYPAAGGVSESAGASIAGAGAMQQPQTNVGKAPSTQPAASASSPSSNRKAAAKAHKGLFYNNDFSYLNKNPFGEIYLGDLLKERNGGRFSIGGQYRARAHFEQNIRGLGLTGTDDQFLLHRTRIYGDLRLTPRLRVYAEMLDAESNYENFAPRPIEVNRWDMQNLFVDATIGSVNGSDLVARVGRQELLLGDQRLISPLDWANTRRTFEGVRLSTRNKETGASFDAFWTNPMRIAANAFDSPDRDQEFMGTYGSWKTRQGRTVDVYALRYLKGRGANAFTYNTFGFRSNGIWTGDWLYDLESAYQFGQNTDGSDHAAGMATLGFGRKLTALGKSPTLWVYYDWASGDDDLGAGNGFHHLFPLGHKYLGFMDLFGRRNIEDVNIRFTTQLTPKIKFLAWHHFFFLANKNDTPYSVVMTPFNPGNAPGDANLGQELDLLLTYAVTPRHQVLLGYSHFFSGDYYSTTPGIPYNGDADFFYTQWTTNF